jgi:hypothetical protein
MRNRIARSHSQPVEQVRAVLTSHLGDELLLCQRRRFNGTRIEIRAGVATISLARWFAPNRSHR